MTKTVHYKVINNFLEINVFNKLKDNLIGINFPWYLNYVLEDHKYYQHTHIFFNEDKVNSDYFDLVQPLIKLLNINKILRIKANFLFKTEQIIEHGLHTDFDLKDAKTAVFYLNTNNGYTKFMDNSIVNSVENRIVIFNSLILHTGTTCTDADYRLVLNINYFN
jgi:hypothetical protein